MKYIITVHIEGELNDADKEALETDLYDGLLELEHYPTLELPTYIDIMEDK